MSRQRLSFWQALGDIGGFHDGLVLLVKLFMVPLSANFFNFNLTKGRPYNKSQPSRGQALKIKQLNLALQNKRVPIPPHALSFIAPYLKASLQNIP